MVGQTVDGNPEMSGERGQTGFERSLQHVLQAVTVAAIIGGAVLLSEVRTSTAVIEQKVIEVKDQISKIESITADRYTATQAREAAIVINRNMMDHENRIRKLEGGRLQP